MLFLRICVQSRNQPILHQNKSPFSCNRESLMVALCHVSCQLCSWSGYQGGGGAANTRTPPPRRVEKNNRKGDINIRKGEGEGSWKRRRQCYFCNQHLFLQFKHPRSVPPLKKKNASAPSIFFDPGYSTNLCMAVSRASSFFSISRQKQKAENKAKKMALNGNYTRIVWFALFLAFITG